MGVAQHLGKVSSVDLDVQTIDVHLVRTQLTNKEWTVNVTEDTKITKGSEEITLEEVKVDDIIRVRGVANRHTRQVEAHKIHILSLRASADQ